MPRAGVAAAHGCASSTTTYIDGVASTRRKECVVEIFQPNLELVVEPDGEYTLNAVTIAPNSGYSAGRAHPGVPPNIRLYPEAFPVILPIRARRGPALQVLMPVRHHLRNLKLGAKLAKTSVVAFAMIGDH